MSMKVHSLHLNHNVGRFLIHKHAPYSFAQWILRNELRRWFVWIYHLHVDLDDEGPSCSSDSNICEHVAKLGHPQLCLRNHIVSAHRFHAM
jgi:hypothetical protein